MSPVGAQIRLGPVSTTYGRAQGFAIQLRRGESAIPEEQFESRLLPLFVNRTRKVAELIPELYLHGLSEGDFDLL